jgi:hypothetical protein
MQARVKALEDPKRGDQLAWLVLRVLAELSPCTERSLIGCVSGGASPSRPGQASDSHTRGLICSALLKLKELAFIQFAQDHIAITDEGRRCLEDLPVVTLPERGCPAEARETKTDRPVATAYREQDSIKSIAKVKVTQLCISSLFETQARLGTRYGAVLRVFATTLRAEYAPRLQRFCQDRLADTRAITQRGFLVSGDLTRNTALQVWKHKLTPMVQSKATTLVHLPVWLVKVCRSHAGTSAFVRWNWRQLGARLSKVATPNPKLAGFDLSRSINFAGALLLVCGILSIVGGVVFLSGKRANSSRAGEVAFLSGNRAESSRGFPIVWLHDGPDRPDRSIFVTRKLAGATWIEGLAIRGENTSNQTLTDIQAAIKTDSGEEIRLIIGTERSQGKQVGAQEVPSGSNFTLESALHPGATRDLTGMPAEEFLTKYGGMIFRVSCTVAGVQKTSIEYFSTSKLRAQLADMNLPPPTGGKQARAF